MVSFFSFFVLLMREEMPLMSLRCMSSCLILHVITLITTCVMIKTVT